MKRLINLYEKMATDVAIWSCTATPPSGKTADSGIATEIRRDVDYITRRVEHEGLSFLTIGLPNFRSDLETALDRGFVSDDLFVGFARIKRQQLPKFMGWLLRLVFDLEKGVLLDDANPEAIRGIRQLAGVFGKILVPCSDARNEAALDKYIECENELETIALELLDDESHLSSIRRIGSLLYRGVLSDLSVKTENYDLMPRHGPGATADRKVGNQKWLQTVWHWRLEDVFPHRDYVRPSYRQSEDWLPVKLVEPGEEAPVRVVLVPKTLKTPRVIAIEPTCMQYTQQAVARALISAIEDSHLLGQMIGFRDQEVNNSLAQEGSLSGELATLDLSEASDRVLNLLVEAVMSSNLAASEALQACRSLKADVPGRGVLPLLKYASMGSALTFPVEAMVFLAIIFYGIEKDLGRPLERRDLMVYRSKVRVYGDDIIVPKAHVLSVVEALESFGLRVNSNKSFWTGKFRESCGKEYFNGADVSYAKLRRMIPSRQTDIEEIISYVSFRNQVFMLGYWRTAAWIDEQLEKLLSGAYPNVHPSSPMLGRITSLHRVDYRRMRWDDDFHHYLERGYVVVPSLPDNGIDGSSALLKWFVSGASRSSDVWHMPSVATDHLLKSGRPLSVKIKRVMARVN